jgi:hypothetical protein
MSRSPPPSPPPPSSPAGSHAHSPPPPSATPASASTLNPCASPLRSANAGSSRLSDELPEWLQFSGSSSSSSDSEAPAPRDGKGKEPQVARKPVPAARGNPTSGFMADARRAASPAAGRRTGPVAGASRGASVVRVEPARQPFQVDEEGWHRVQRKGKRAQRPATKRGKVPADLVGLCFNCFSEEHVARLCPNPSCCLRCRRPGHQAQDCNRPRLLLGDRGRLHQRRGRLHRAAPSRFQVRAPSPRPKPRSPPRDVTPPGLDCSADDNLDPPAICGPPTDSSPSPPPSSPERPPPPIGAPQRRLCVIHRSGEMAREEQALELALVAMVGGSRPSVSLAAVRRWLNDNFGIPSARFSVRRYHPEDFLIIFSSPDDMSTVPRRRARHSL